MKDPIQEIETYDRLLHEYADACQAKEYAEVRLIRVFDELIPMLREDPEQRTRAEEAHRYVEILHAMSSSDLEEEESRLYALLENLKDEVERYRNRRNYEKADANGIKEA